MSTATVHHAYNDVVATHYDLDPQGVIGRSLDRGIRQMRQEGLLEAGSELHVLDVGMGTGLFLGKLVEQSEARIVPFGVDLADNMLEVARRRLPGLTAVAGDASDLDAHFPGKQFDCICTHFVTGFVGMKTLAPQIASRLKPGGWWSLVGGTKAAYKALQAKGDSRILRMLSGAGDRRMDDTVLNPADLAEVARIMEAHGLDVRRGETFEPPLAFEDFDAFMEFGHRGGWLTPLIEEMGLHKAGPLKRWLINRLAFPVEDAHNIVVALGRKR
ncbi:class I SAM-dependent methyltransferase [Paludisphaera mucosa]|uniref:Class I SAM-dependent methyltransferase n=1 Tax=Paludisphaera mucosa TaxID=3030827 RepID=A0ABT6FAX7_9BACT|nr:class I SAM-dependent methyltransferase [Paludisphaera mucosa]MDG3004701.1 class I SAM-dependent methyltransferase [Paludisphaera mucosa]